MNLRARASRLVDAVNSAAAVACYGLLIAITGVTAMQVFLRYMLNRPTSWSEEIALLLLIWFGLIAVAVGIRRNEHLAITFLRDRLPLPIARALDYGAQLGMLVFMAVVMWFGQDLIALAGRQLMPASGLPKSWLYIPALVGGGLGVVNALANLLLRQVPTGAQETLADNVADLTNKGTGNAG
ncbi:TRAP transporter small permease [Szabonella alba]|uniref:TRAP transporter small permease protein n=1 Tax=Szabonella alba TaxID=2804194 RepID=A0A8K0Y1M1_9RHOB|nr:TRAP transporter small permease [Szabonella alba]MBL4919006.1 TRAP transporter small permease [Szabonella alba]